MARPLAVQINDETHEALQMGHRHPFLIDFSKANDEAVRLRDVVASLSAQISQLSRQLAEETHEVKKWARVAGDYSSTIEQLRAVLRDCPEGHDEDGVYHEWRDRHAEVFKGL